MGAGGAVGRQVRDDAQIDESAQHRPTSEKNTTQHGRLLFTFPKKRHKIIYQYKIVSKNHKKSLASNAGKNTGDPIRTMPLLKPTGVAKWNRRPIQPLRTDAYLL
jgi:hypothetical protein